MSLPLTPYKRMEEWYRVHQSIWPLGKYIEWHLQVGVVINTPEVFVMGRCVPKNADAWRITDSMMTFPKEQCDCWYVFAFAGDLAKGLHLLPWELPWLGFNRRGRKELKFVPTSRIRSLCHGKLVWQTEDASGPDPHASPVAQRPSIARR